MKSRMKPLVVFGCTHVGHENSDLKLAGEYIRFIRKNDALVLVLGDNFECALPHKGHMMFSQNLSPQAQLDFGINLLKPIAGQIVGACSSNHSARAKKVAGIDMDKVMADKLGYSDRYYPHQGYISVAVGKQTYDIAFKHGSSCGSDTFRNCKDLLRSFP